MKTPVTLTSTWQRIVLGASVLLVQTNVGAEFYIGTAPTPTDKGFIIKSDTPYLIPEVAALGGEVWARGVGELVYASDV
jgi:hypothetical protein